MIGTIDIQTNAEHPNIALQPLVAFVDSPSTVRIKAVPKKLGAWEITNVYIQISYPDNTVFRTECTKIDGIWVGTVNGCEVAGCNRSGYSILADGFDENGGIVENYVLGVGDVTILPHDTAVLAGLKNYYVHILEGGVPVNPLNGDMVLQNGIWQVWYGGQWIKFGETEEAYDAVSYGVAQMLSQEQMHIARTNINAVDAYRDANGKLILTY